MDYTLKKIHAEVRIISGRPTSQENPTRVEVDGTNYLELPNSGEKSGGACTKAFLKAMNNIQSSNNRITTTKTSFQDVLLQMKDTLKEEEYAQFPELTSSRSLDINTPFHIVPENCTGKRRALIIGINYTIQQKGELRACQNDAINMKAYLMREQGFLDEDIMFLTDDGLNVAPTKANILSSMRTLATLSNSGDACFFYFSGHGGKIRGEKYDKNDGYETLIPCDFKYSGHIGDEVIIDMLVGAIPAEVTLTMLMDCCYGGTVLDLPYTFNVDNEHDKTEQIHGLNIPQTSFVREVKSVAAEIHMISGCKDSQTSADVSDVGPYELPNPAGKAGGACTSALLQVMYSRHESMEPELSFQDVILRMRDILHGNNMTQVPQLTSSRPLDIKEPFYIVPNDNNKFKGTRRAVIIGINYTGQNGELSGCHNDAQNIKEYLINLHAFREEDIKMLLDDDLHEAPTKENILNAFKNIATECEEGDACYVHYSGHGGSIKDLNDDESDGCDETLIPVDFMTSGEIIDDEIYHSLVIQLPQRVTLTCVIDSCHSGTVLDLPFIFKAPSNKNNEYISDKMVLQPQLDHNTTNSILSVIEKIDKEDNRSKDLFYSDIESDATYDKYESAVDRDDGSYMSIEVIYSKSKYEDDDSAVVVPCNKEKNDDDDESSTDSNSTFYNKWNFGADEKSRTDIDTASFSSSSTFDTIEEENVVMRNDTFSEKICISNIFCEVADGIQELFCKKKYKGEVPEYIPGIVIEPQ